MIVIKILPRNKRIAAMAIFPFILITKGSLLSDRIRRHEMIHFRQQLEMLILPFYLWYILEWLIRTIATGKDSYRSISFEKEAYANEHIIGYRKWFGWIKYL